MKSRLNERHHLSGNRGMIKRMGRHPVTFFVVGFAVLYFIAVRYGYGDWLDPLFGLGAGLLVYRYLSRAAAVLPWAYAVVQAAVSLGLSKSGTLMAAAVMGCGYLLLADFSPGRVWKRLRWTGMHIRLDYMEPVRIDRGMGDVRLDLSSAIIPKGEHRVLVERWVGSIVVYVPPDVEVSVVGKAGAGSMDVLGSKSTRFNRCVEYQSEKYSQSGTRLHIVVTTMAGDVAVKYL
ncbi:cell wall-active antibiotics response protein LiaF [Paenibacillus sp. 32352]|uniref:cell wall-active antibiotics response protein LiaF n=1 Tax=Paenibacillus sp. 32352 TaxID=1969111 RepID=UPI0009AE659D|nr:cell wall-active antibiotics response protein LiaF [Paenibacillus sp. 32352]